MEKPELIIEMIQNGMVVYILVLITACILGSIAGFRVSARGSTAFRRWAQTWKQHMQERLSNPGLSGIELQLLQELEKMSYELDIRGRIADPIYRSQCHRRLQYIERKQLGGNLVRESARELDYRVESII